MMTEMMLSLLFRRDKVNIPPNSCMISHAAFYTHCTLAHKTKTLYNAEIKYKAPRTEPCLASSSGRAYYQQMSEYM